MKTSNKFLLSVLLCLCACTTNPAPYDTEISILIDQTDPLSVCPKAEDILSLSKLTDNIWQGIRVRLSYISDKDINDEREIILPRGNSFLSNPQRRQAEVARFTKQVHALGVVPDSGITCTHSIVYRTIAERMNALSESKASNKHLLIYSNLMENSTLSFYDPATLELLQKNPKAIQDFLEHSVALKDISGTSIHFIHSPASYEENTAYMQVALFFKRLFESKGAIVHLQSRVS